MKSTTKSLDRSKGPLSVHLPADLRARLQAQALKRRLKLATTVRMFLDAHVREIEENDELGAAEAWQREQAWATWEKIRAGDGRDVPEERLANYAEQALKRLNRSRPRRK